MNKFKMRRDFKWIQLCFWILLLGNVSGQFDPNVTLQNIWGRLQPNLRSLIQCQSDDNHKKIKFSRVIDTGQGMKLPRSSQQFLQGKPIFARILFMHGDDAMARFGAFQCKIVQKDILTRISTLKLPPDNLVELDAVQPYLRASVGESVYLEVKMIKPLELPIRWLHNGKRITEWDDKTRVQIKTVQILDEGLYECHYVGRREEGLHALIQLLVRSCPDDLYGSDCKNKCPPCYNGGVCHDKWGECICPAGFKGTNCEIPCGGNHFGADCDKYCSPPASGAVQNSSTDELCALHLFCKPDPYGCACAPGFKGAKCMEHCEPGWYGADCKEPCHCAYGSSNCNRITGMCDGGCARGWRGQSCQIEDPNSNDTFVETTTMVSCAVSNFGPSCERECYCAGHEPCHISTGHCATGCDDGWGGPNCGVCRSGRFGERCRSRCHCVGGDYNCDSEGYCHSGCEAGWAGFTCQAECTAGRFGPNCASTCHCSVNSTCDKKTGDCDGGDCEPGYMENDCQTICPANRFGVNCLNECSCANGAQCNRLDGSCACEGQWRGITCNESEPQIVAATDEEVNSGQQVFISCTADAVPQPIMNISCRDYPDLRVSLRTLDQNQQQAIVKLKPEKAGIFEFLCIARNNHGFDMQKIILTVVDPPGLQTAPILKNISSNSITVQWRLWDKSKDIGGLLSDVIEYLVVYREADYFTWTRVDNWKGWTTEPSITVNGLRPNTRFQFAIQCRRQREGGVGPLSPIAIGRTQCGDPLPSGVPKRFLPETISSTWVSLTWIHPDDSLLQCTLKLYHVTYHPEAEESILSAIDIDEMTNLKLEDLTPNTNYVVRIYPVTEVRKSNYYAELIFRTSETVPGPVSDLLVESPEDKPDILLVSWEAPSERHGSIKGYQVTLMLLDKGQCGNISDVHDSNLIQVRQIPAKDTAVTLPNLNPYSIYNISVKARTSAGLGELVSKMVITPESVPAIAPPNIHLTSSTNYSLSFAWNEIPCELSNGDVLHYDYTVVLSKAIQLEAIRKKRSSSDSMFVSVTDRQVTVRSLKPYTDYGFMVAAVTTAGRGILSDIHFHKTDEGVPSAVRDLFVSSTASEDLTLTWNKPEKTNGIILHYKICLWVEDKLFKEVIQHPTEYMKDVQEITLLNLTPATLYNITVEAATRAGYGEVNQITGKTLDAAPDAPFNLLVSNSETTRLNLSWEKPSRANGDIIEYKVLYVPISSLDPHFDSSTFREQQLVTRQTHIQLNDLHTSTQYNISVAARTRAGLGRAAHIVFWTRILGEHVSPSLRTLQVQATNDTIKIVFSTTGSTSVYKYQVIVEDLFHNDPINETLLSNFESAVERDGLPYYIAAEIDPQYFDPVKKEQEFVVGDRRMWGGYNNVHLNPGHEYKIRIRTLIFKDKESRWVLSQPQNATAGLPVLRNNLMQRKIFGLNFFLFILIAAVIFLFLFTLAFCGSVAICFRRQRKKKTFNGLLSRDTGLSGSLTWSVLYKVPESEGTLVPEGFRTLPLTQRNSVRSNRSDSKIIRRTENLEDYLVHAQSSSVIADEFNRLVDGQISSWTVARKTGNLKKNRYGNILPYDRHRVILGLDSNKADSDYINASYIDGFKRPREYIVTQGPLENTVLDFWRMIWQEKAPVIVMVTEIVENGKKKSSVYWPEDSIDTGDLHILLIHSEHCGDYVIRTLLIRKIDENRTHRVTQYQYTSWPDRTVPSKIHNIIKFTKRIREDHPVLHGPMVVHCSAGAGRSGTFVAIDALWRQALEEKRVDVFRFVNNVRHQRVHLVQTLEQYAFIYQALIEAVQFEDTSIPLEKICACLKELDHMSTIDRRATILKQYYKLNRILKKSDSKECSVALSETNIFRNRDPLTVPGDTLRVKLNAEETDTEKNDYINAIYIDGYRQAGAYLVTQTPLPHTVRDFWRLIYQEKSPLIIMLHNNTENLDVGVYWPEQGFSSFGDLEIQLVTFEEQRDVIVHVMRLSNKLKMDEDPLKVLHLQYTGWTSEIKATSLLSLVETVERWYLKSTGGPITVHCVDGATRCGLFIAATHVCDQIESEGQLDAFQIVKRLRNKRPEFIPNSDQYRLLFEMAQDLAEPFLNSAEETAVSKKFSFKI